MVFLCQDKCAALPTPSFGRSPGPGREGDSFGLQVPPLAGLPGAGGLQPRFCGNPSTPPSFAERRRGSRQNPFPPGFLIHRPPRRAILAGENWGWAKNALQVIRSGFESVIGGTFLSGYSKLFGLTRASARRPSGFHRPASGSHRSKSVRLLLGLATGREK